MTPRSKKREALRDAKRIESQDFTMPDFGPATGRQIRAMITEAVRQQIRDRVVQQLKGLDRQTGEDDREGR